MGREDAIERSGEKEEIIWARNERRWGIELKMERKRKQMKGIVERRAWEARLPHGGTSKGEWRREGEWKKALRTLLETPSEGGWERRTQRMTEARKAAMSNPGAEVVRANKARRMEIGPAWDLFKQTRPRRKPSAPYKQIKAELKEQATELKEYHEENVAKMDRLVLKGRIVVKTDEAGRRTYVEKVKNCGYADLK